MGVGWVERGQACGGVMQPATLNVDGAGYSGSRL